ncbi:MAG: hypothetical protein LBB76_11355 [Azoarcus sp.]|nr:hypothetical protein [Azoarcus sp.]
MAVKFNGQVYLFEFKVVEETQAPGKAWRGSRRKNTPIHLIGVEFSRSARNVVGFEVEAIQRIQRAEGGKKKKHLPGPELCS